MGRNTVMSEDEMFEFASQYGESPEEYHSELMERLKGMKDEDVPPLEGAKLAWLCKREDPEYFEENWASSEHTYVVSEWLAGTIFLAAEDGHDWNVEFDRDVDV